MSIKYFCDCCGRELLPSTLLLNPGEQSTQKPNEVDLRDHPNMPAVRILVGKVDKDQVHWNEGDWCKYCILQHINTLDDRPKAHYG